MKLILLRQTGSWRLAMGLDDPRPVTGVGGDGAFSSLLRVQTGPEVHLASYKMSTERFLGGGG